MSTSTDDDPPPPVGEPVAVESTVPALPARRTSRSLPPPIPVDRRTTLQTLAIGRPERPTVLELAITRNVFDVAARTAQLSDALERLKATDRAQAAICSYELGELWERDGNHERALDAYRVACELDSMLVPARWGVRRILEHLERWKELATAFEALIDGDLSHLERADLLLERAVVPHQIETQRLALALQLVPGNLEVLFECERQAVAGDNPKQIGEALGRLAESFETPAWKVAYSIEHANVVSSFDRKLADAALLAARELLDQAPDHAERLARARLRIIDPHDSSELDAALRTLGEVLATRTGDREARRELAAIFRRRATLAADPQRSWELLTAGLVHDPGDPVLLAGAVEHPLGRADLPRLLRAWCHSDVEAGRNAMIGTWCADTFAREPLWSWTMLDSLTSLIPGYLVTTAVIEAHALADIASHDKLAMLAEAYVATAHAAQCGEWAWTVPSQPDPDEAVALQLQAAELLAYQIGTPASTERAHQILQEAHAAAPTHPVVIEALIDLEDAVGLGSKAVARVRPTGDDVRALQIAYGHEMFDSAVEILEKMAAANREPWFGWQLVAMLQQLGRDHFDASLGLLDDRDRARRGLALLHLATLKEHAGDLAGAADYYRQLYTQAPDDLVIRDAFLDAYRAAGRWEELAEFRLQRADEVTDAREVRRELQEAAWVLEVKLDDPQRARDVFATWSTRLPEDRMALSGLARCCAKLRDHQREVAARTAIVALDPSPESRWRLACSLELAGRFDAAIVLFRSLLDEPDSIARVAAAAAIGDLAHTGSLELRAEAAQILASQTSHPLLAATLQLELGWIRLLAFSDPAAAARAFTAALDHEPERADALLGLILVSACEPELSDLGDITAAFAAKIDDPAFAAAMSLRAAALARDERTTAERIDHALRLVPDGIDAVFAATETEAQSDAELANDPFAAVDQLIARADLLARRAELAESQGRALWLSERAEALEHAGNLPEATKTLLSLVREDPRHELALQMYRELAKRAGDDLMVAHSSYLLARGCTDQVARLSLLREAVAVYERSSTTAVHALVTYRAICEADPAAPEFDRLVKLLRDGNHGDELVTVLSSRATQLAGSDPSSAVTLICERARVLRSLGQHEQAARDIETVKNFAPNHNAFMQLVVERPDRTSSDAWDASSHSEITDAEVLLPTLTDVKLGIQRLPAPDPFDSTTQRADLSSLQDEERRIASSSQPPPLSRHTMRTTLPLDPTEPLIVPSVLSSSETSPKLVEPPFELTMLEFPEDAADSQAVLLSYSQLQPLRSAASEDLLLQYKRELPHADAARAVVLHCEAGRLSRLLGQVESARAHYETALTIDPRSRVALRGLRRIARAADDLGELARLLDLDIAIAGPHERAPLQRHLIDVLLAAREHDLARVAVGNLLDSGANDPALRLAYLELALVDRRVDEVRETLEILAETLQGDLRAAIESARSVLAQASNDLIAAMNATAAAAAADADSFATRLAVLRDTVACGRREQAIAGLLELAYEVEKDDPIASTALAMRAHCWAGRQVSAETGDSIAQLVASACPREAFVAWFAAEVASSPEISSHAFVRWSRSKCPPADRAYAAARAAELAPQKLARLWSQVLEIDPDNDFAAARWEIAQREAGNHTAVIERELALARDGNQRALLRAVTELVRQREHDRAIEEIEACSEPLSLAAAEALVSLYGSAGRWSEQAARLDELARDPRAPADVMRLRAALARDRTSHQQFPDEQTRQLAIAAALHAWHLVLDVHPAAALAHAASIALARRSSDPNVLPSVLERADSDESSRAVTISLSLQRARLALVTDARSAEQVLGELVVDDPRVTFLRILAAATRQDLCDAATSLETLATTRTGLVAAVLRLRAGTLALRAGNKPRAHVALAAAQRDLPGIVDELIRAADPAPAPLRVTSFTRALREAERVAARGDRVLALELFQHAHSLAPGELHAWLPLVQLATQLDDTSVLTAFAFERLRSATELGSASRIADAHEQLARVYEQLGDRTNACAAYESALGAAPGRYDLILRLERMSAARADHPALLKLRELRARIPHAPTDRHAILVDTVRLARRVGTPDQVIQWCRAALEGDPTHDTVLYARDITLRGRPSPELVEHREHLAKYWSPRAAATSLVRAGETLVALGNRQEAVVRFSRAAEIDPGNLVALEDWYETALSAEAWHEVARATIRRIDRTVDKTSIASHHHFAGVVWMDRTHDPAAAVDAFRKALDQSPRHLDAFIRLRLLMPHAPELGSIIERRLESEPDPLSKVEYNRMLAEFYRATNEREKSLRHYRAMLALQPTDARAHAAIADLATDSTQWREAAETVRSRIPLEKDVVTLRALHHRLGELHADHEVAVALEAIQQALALVPDDLESLTRLAELATKAGKWDVAFEACDRLVSLERAPDRLAAHLRRASTIFDRGFGERKRAEHMLLLALESAPTSVEGLQLLLQLYRQPEDRPHARGHLVRIADAMRERVAHDSQDRAAYRMLSHAAAALAEFEPQRDWTRVAHAANEVSILLGATADELPRLAGHDTTGEVTVEQLFAGAAEPELCRALQRLAQPLAKLVGTDLAKYSVSRKDRLRSNDLVSLIVREVASKLGIREPEVYISHDVSTAVALETRPLSLVLSQRGAADPSIGRFAIGAALKLSQLELGVAARMSRADLQLYVHAIVGLVRGEISNREERIGACITNLRKLVPAKVVEELGRLLSKPTFNVDLLARDLEIAGFRAGYLATGTLLPGLMMLSSNGVLDLKSPVAQGLVAFALRVG
jgi:tetratricopeptide (TPR) repeat protein